MMKKLLLFMLALWTVSAYGQSNALNGRVTDDSGEPLVSAYVLVKGTSYGVVTDIDGNYAINVQPDQTLVFSYLGMTPQEIVYSGQTVQNVIMTGNETLEEVVVIGYQTIRKSDLTGAVAVVNAEEMGKGSAGTVGSQLQGLATGVSVRSTGKAGEDAFIEIRGAGTLGDRSPLWVIDGMIMNPGVDFNPHDIESLQVLKDASAAAIYGSRAANGVILVTTKSGQKGPMKIGINAKVNFEWSPMFDLMNAEEYKYYNDIAYDEGILNGSWNGTRQNHSSYDTDWQKETFRVGKVQDYNVSLSGGGDNASYFVSGGYYKNKGVSFGNEFDRYTFRVNTRGKRGVFSFGENLSYSYTDKDPLQTNPYNDVVRMMPTIPLHDENNPGGFGYGSADANTFGTNPVARETLERQTEKQNRINGSVWMELKPLSWISYKINGGIDAYFWERHWFRGIGNWTRNQSFADTQSTVQRQYTYTKLLEQTINFDHKFGKHSVNGVVGMTYQHYFRENLQGSRLGFPAVGNDWLQVLDAGQYSQTNSGSINEYAMISYLGRLNYIYDSKYYFTATFRNDGTSKLVAENRWGTFPSFSGAWRISQENFFHVSWINDLKLRANWGRLGNVNIGSWDYLSTVNQTIVAYLGTGLVSGATQVRINNKNLVWETKETTNIGADMVLFRNRLSLGMEYYISKSKDVLTDMPIAMSTGNTEAAPQANAASLKNSGFEFSSVWRDKVKDFSYSIGVNLTTLKNEIVDLGYGKDVYYTERTKSEIGHSLGMFYLYKTNGIFRTQEQIDNYVTSNGTPILIDEKRPQLGDLWYIDHDDDGQLSSGDRQLVGNPWPTMQLSINFNAEWKNFDFSMFWYGQFGNDILNASRWQGRLFADNSNYIRFKPGEEPYQVNPNGSTPRLVYGDFRNTHWSDVNIEKGSYFRLKNVQLGYTFGKNLLGKVGVEALRIYVSGSNLVTFTKYNGLDPDFINSNIWEMGVDDFAFPNMRTFMFGLDLTF